MDGAFPASEDNPISRHRHFSARFVIGVVLLIVCFITPMLMLYLAHFDRLRAHLQILSLFWWSHDYLFLYLMGIIGYLIGFILILCSPERSRAEGKTVKNLAVVFAVVGVIGGSITLPAWSPGREKATNPSCFLNQKHFAIMILTFAQDHEGRLPKDWSEFTAALVEYGYLSPKFRTAEITPSSLLYCPDTIHTFTQPGGYGLNVFVLGKSLASIPDPGETIFSADSRQLNSLLHSFADIDMERHGGPIISTLDGGTRGVLSKERWSAYHLK